MAGAAAATQDHAEAASEAPARAPLIQDSAEAAGPVEKLESGGAVPLPADRAAEQIARTTRHPADRQRAVARLQRRHGNRYAAEVVAALRARAPAKPEEGSEAEGEADAVAAVAPEDMSAQDADAGAAADGAATAATGAEEAGPAPPPPSGAAEMPGKAAAAPPATTPIQRRTQPWVTAPGDPAEREAAAVARSVMRPRNIAPSIRETPPEAQLPRAPASQPPSQPPSPGNRGAALPSGAPLPDPVRTDMEHRFAADFSGVRVHSGGVASDQASAVGAQAFTTGNHIVFGQNQYGPGTDSGRELIAHELTHTIQQGAVAQTRDTGPEVRETRAPGVQRLGISDALDYFADKANLIPGFRMFTIILGVNPVNMSSVPRTAANILRAIVEFIPGGGLIVMALDSYGVFERVGTWVEEQFATLTMTGAMIRDSVMDFLDSLGWRDIFDLGGVWERAKRIFTEPIDQLIAFGTGLVTGIIDLIKAAILAPLAAAAQGWSGFPLLCAVLGYNPIDGTPVERNAETLIGGFMTMIGQQEIWQNIQEANAIERAFAWFQGALSGLLAFVMSIPTLFVQALQALQIADIVNLPKVIVKVVTIFTDAIAQFAGWAFEQVMGLLQIIFEVVAPAVVPYIKKASGAFQTILRDPIAFVGNLVRAGMRGLNQFKDRFLEHLQASLIQWLTGALGSSGVYIPQALTLQELVKFVTSVLGLTWADVRAKLVDRIGEGPVAAMEEGFDLVVTLVRDGPAAAWAKIVEHLANLRDMVIGEIMGFVQSRIVETAIVKLVSMLSPAGAFIQAIIATYNTIMFFVERLRQIAQVAMAVIDSIAEIAAGSIGAAANKVEQTMAGLLTLVISFLARQAGLGRVSDAVLRLIEKIRAPIDTALDRVIDWIIEGARALGNAIFGGGAQAEGEARTEPEEEAPAPGDHDAIATAAVTDLENAIGDPQDFESARDLLEAAVPRVEAQRGALLEEGIGIRVTLPDRAADQADDDLDFEVVIAPNDTRKTGAVLLADMEAAARAAFPARLFTKPELATALGKSVGTTQRYIQKWKGSGILFELSTDTFDPAKKFSFDAGKAGQREYESRSSNRATYGYVNPPHNSGPGMAILAKGFNSQSPRPTRPGDWSYHDNDARYESKRPGSGYTDFPRSEAILGHDESGAYKGASDHWNKVGYTQSRADNLAWNRNAGSYWGPEHTAESSASGGSAPRYKIPSASLSPPCHSDWE